MNEDFNQLREQMVHEQLRDLQGRASDVCDAEYGFRDDNHSLVFHFFPPGYGLDNSVDWKDWYNFRDRLEKALLACFDIKHVEAGYVPELRSFYLIIKPRPHAPDMHALFTKFFEELEA